MRDDIKNNIMFLVPMLIVILVFFPIILLKNIKNEEKISFSEISIQKNNKDIKKLKDLINEKRLEIENAKIKIKNLENEKFKIVNEVSNSMSFDEKERFIKINSKEKNTKKNIIIQNKNKGGDKIQNKNKIEEIKVRRIGENIQSYELYWPVSSKIVTSHFGERRHPILNEDKFHRGIDIASNKGDVVFSGMNGIVTYSGEKGNYGNLIEIERSDGLKVRYAHLDKIYVNIGDSVKVGEKIGEVGNTGMSTGPHLHYEVLVEEIPVNPIKFKYVDINF